MAFVHTDGGRGGCRDRGRIVLAGPSTATAPLARDLIGRGLDPLWILGRTPGESSEATAGSPDRALPLPSAEELRDATVVILAEAEGWAPSAFEEMASRIARLAPAAIVVVSGEHSNEAALRFLRRSRIEPNRVMATGGMAVQILLERAFALDAAVSRAQVSVIVIGRQDGGVLPLARSIRVAGIPAAMLPGAVPGPRFREAGASGSSRAAADRAAVALLADGILHDRRRVFCCGSLSPSGRGLPESFLTLPALVGAGGILGAFPLGLTLEERAFLSREAGSSP